VNGQYEVLNPWAEVDPILLRRISPRIVDLTGKRIGLFRNLKRSSKPILNVVERELVARFPASDLSWYESTKVNTPEVETEGKPAFEEWVKGVDAVIVAVGD